MVESLPINPIQEAKVMALPQTRIVSHSSHTTKGQYDRRMSGRFIHILVLHE